MFPDDLTHLHNTAINITKSFFIFIIWKLEPTSPIEFIRAEKPLYLSY
jgi:hypothetical protein